MILEFWIIFLHSKYKIHYRFYILLHIYEIISFLSNITVQGNFLASYANFHEFYRIKAEIEGLKSESKEDVRRDEKSNTEKYLALVLPPRHNEGNITVGCITPFSRN